MFRWCTYCQKFLGEAEPRSNFEISHGASEKCKVKAKTDGESLASCAQPMVEFIKSINSKVLNHKNRITGIDFTAHPDIHFHTGNLTDLKKIVNSILSSRAA